MGYLFHNSSFYSGVLSIPRWLCSFRRYTYFLSHHSVKWSLLIVSLERLVAVKWPYKHQQHFTTRRTVPLILFVWFTIAIIDSVPLYSGRLEGDKCSYSPDTVWSFSVVVVFNILPFLWMVANYFVIWRLSVNFSISDKERMKIKRESGMSTLSMSYQEDTEGTSFIRSESKNDDEKENGEYESATTESTNSDSKTPPGLSTAFVFPTAQYRTRPDTDTTTQKRTSPLEKFKSKSKFITESLKLSIRLQSSKLFLLNLKATKTCFLLVVVYVCCWGPLGIFYTIDQFCSKCLSQRGAQRYVRMGIKALCFSSSVFIPVVYCWFSSVYKRAAKRLYQRIKLQWHNSW